MARTLAAALALLLLPLLVLPASAQEAAVGLAGRISGPGDEAVEGATVTIVAESAPGTVVATAQTAADGTWQAEVPDGRYLVHAAAPALADGWWVDAGETAEAEVVTVAEGAGPQDLAQVLPRGGAIAGTVRSHDGPVAGATVRVERTPFWAIEATTGADGAYRLEGVRPGSRTVAVLAGDPELADASEPVEVSADTVAEVAVTLRPRPQGVERVSGPDRVATAVQASRRGFLTASTVVIAGAAAFPDALAASPLAASVGGPLLLVGPRLTPVVVEEIRRLGAREAVVVGAIGVVPLIVQEELRRLGLEVRRLAGENRFDTAALIARDVGTPGGRAIVAGGLSFADALSVAPYAAAERIPILLTGPERLHADAAAALRDLGVTETLVVGGTAVVSDAVLAALPSPTRVRGADRYATSLAIAGYWAERGMRLQTVHAATGRDFPDALAAGPIAALAEGPLLLVDGKDARVPDATYRWLAEHREAVDGVYAFGGSAVMGDDVLQRLSAAIGGSS